MKKKAYRIVSTLLVLVFALALTVCGAALKNATKMSEYEIGGESIPSITSVVGEREVTGVESSINNGRGGVQTIHLYERISLRRPFGLCAKAHGRRLAGHGRH